MDKQIPSLGGLRAISIIIVLIGHFFEAGYLKYNVKPSWMILIDSGFGVNIFFVISGFLITKLLLIEGEKRGDVSLKKFYIRRFFRILPAYYFVVLVYFVLEAYFHLLHFSGISWLTTITLTKYLSPDFDWASAHFWSLSVEEHFYLLFPFIFKFLPKYRNVLLVVSVFIICFLRFLIFTDRVHLLINSFSDYNVTIFQRGDAIAIGCLVALNYQKVALYINKFKTAVKYPVLFSIVIIVAYKACFDVFHLHLGALYMFNGVGATSTLANFFIAIILVSSIEFNNVLWYKFLNLSFINYVGKLSFSIYLWQQLFMSYKQVFFFQKLPFNILFIVLAALTSYYFVEKPFLKFRALFN